LLSVSRVNQSYTANILGSLSYIEKSSSSLGDSSPFLDWAFFSALALSFSDIAASSINSSLLIMMSSDFDGDYDDNYDDYNDDYK